MHEHDRDIAAVFADEAAKRAFMLGMATIAHSNGDYARAEAALLGALAESIGFEGDPGQLPSDGSVQPAFANAVQEERFVVEALRLALVDGSYEESERQALLRLCQGFGWGEDRFAALEEKERRMDWLKRNAAIEVD